MTLGAQPVPGSLRLPPHASAAVLCPGPSLTETWPKTPLWHDIVIAVNSARSLGADWWVTGRALQAEDEPEVKGVLALADDQSPREGLHVLDRRLFTTQERCNVVRRHARNGAIWLAAWMGAKEVYVYGDDQEGSEHFDGSRANDTPQRWRREDDFAMRIARHLGAEGVAVKRVLSGKGRLRILLDGLPPVVSFGTLPEYEEELAALVASCDEYGVRHDVEQLECRGSWQANTQLKAEFVRRKLGEHEGPIVWLDADARVRATPTLFALLDCDIGAHYLLGTRLQSGTLCLGNTEKCRQLVDAWVADCKRHPATWDQVCLENVIKRTEGLKVERLPTPYCVIDRITTEQTGAVIYHTQASRHTRRDIHDRVAAERVIANRAGACA